MNVTVTNGVVVFSKETSFSYKRKKNVGLKPAPSLFYDKAKAARRAPVPAPPSPPARKRWRAARRILRCPSAEKADRYGILPEKKLCACRREASPIRKKHGPGAFPADLTCADAKKRRSSPSVEKQRPFLPDGRSAGEKEHSFTANQPPVCRASSLPPP